MLTKIFLMVPVFTATAPLDVWRITNTSWYSSIYLGQLTKDNDLARGQKEQL